MKIQAKSTKLLGLEVNKNEIFKSKKKIKNYFFLKKIILFKKIFKKILFKYI